MAQPKTILIIDDDDDLRTALAEQLALGDEFRVVEAAAGAQGVEAARTARRTSSCSTSTCPTSTVAKSRDACGRRASAPRS